MMCYDISFTAKLKELPAYFPEMVDSPQLKLDFKEDHIIAHRYPEYPIIRRNLEGAVILQSMEWGVIPFYVKDETKFIRQRASMLNARAERILDDPKSVWNKIKNRRCQIPVTGILTMFTIIMNVCKYRMPLFLPLDLAKRWIELELPEKEYRKILGYEMSPENMNYIPVWTIRSPKDRPDGKLKTEYWEWKDLPALGEKNPSKIVKK